VIKEKKKNTGFLLGVATNPMFVRKQKRIKVEAKDQLKDQY